MIRANFDYEFELFHNQKNDSINKQFEYLYWWTENKLDPLSTKTIYAEEYLDYITECLQKVISTSPAPYQQNWWGDLNDLKLERLLNSKLTSTQFALQENLAHPLTKIITNQNEINLLDDEMYVLKNPYLMSGKGFMRFVGKEYDRIKNWAEKELKNNPLIFEPWVKKLYDIGTYIFLDEKKMESYFNLSNEQGNYKGTVVYADHNLFFEDLEERGVNLDFYLESLNRIQNYYVSLGATKGFSVDSFIYQEKQSAKMYYLSEVNYRKTMGWVSLKLKKFLDINGVGQFLIMKRPKEYKNFIEYKQCFESVLYSREKKKGVLLLSPENHNFVTFFVAAHSKEELDNYLFFMANL